MMVSKTEVLRKKLTRGAILYMLYISQDAPMLSSTLELALVEQNPGISGELTPQINFLRDRGYIKVMGGQVTGKASSTLLRITADGQDIVEGTVEDASVAFGEAERM